jgi:hypothetical protein
MIDHPEAKRGEVHIGNIYPSDFRRIGWISKRLGKVPRGADGEVLKGGNMRPVFVLASEMQAAGCAIEGDGPLDHRW